MPWSDVAAGSPIGGPGGVDGGVAAARPHAIILHSDRGCQFISDECQQFLAAHHIICCMSAGEVVPITAAAESFFGVLKRAGEPAAVADQGRGESRYL
jgi:transposase InsO family protein